MGSHDDELAALLVLLSRRPGGAGWNEIAIEVATRGSAVSVLADLSGETLFGTVSEDAELASTRQIVKQWNASGYHVVTVLDEGYPSRLLGIRETPPFLFYEGTLSESDPGMSVVGSRSASEAGLRLAADAAHLLVSKGLTVIAGLAKGVDAAAHRAALDAGGRTVAFIGTGITRSYPASNAALQKEIAAQGLVLSQFYPDSPPTKQSFPMRNATMSGYGLATIVIEAGEHSGTRIQARAAGEHGRPVILTSKVTHTTRWGTALVDQPNVYVIDTLAELGEAVEIIRETPNQLQSALDALVSV